MNKIMDIDEAKHIVKEYGAYWADIGAKLNLYFHGKIPESFLPFSLEDIEEACVIYLNHYYGVSGYENYVEAVETLVAILDVHIDDELAIKESIKCLTSEKCLSVTLNSLKEFSHKKRNS